MGEYAHTWAALRPSGDIDVDSGRGGLYTTWFNHGLYLNGAIYGGHNTYESSRSSLGGLATGGSEGGEWSTFISGGYDLHFGQLTLGPIAALQYTYLDINGFSENSSLAPLEIHSGSAESLLSQQPEPAGVGPDALEKALTTNDTAARIRQRPKRRAHCRLATFSPAVLSSRLYGRLDFP
jgi:Autotransporter beta-domain